MMSEQSITTTFDQTSHIGLTLKVLYTAFVAFHLWANLPFYGPLNYLWFCDIAMVATTFGLWMENRLILSMVAMAITGPAGLWTVDLLWRLLRGEYLFGMASYMSDPSVPLPIRIASTFHLWLPLLLFGCLWNLGYDRRTLVYQTLFAISLLVVCRLVSSPPPPRSPTDEVNINFVYGHSDIAAQTRFPSWIYLALMIGKYWICMYLPLHLIFLLLFHTKQRSVLADVSPNEV